MLCLSVFHTWSLSLDYILLISARILIPLITPTLYIIPVLITHNEQLLKTTVYTSFPKYFPLPDYSSFSNYHNTIRRYSFVSPIPVDQSSVLFQCHQYILRTVFTTYPTNYAGCLFCASSLNCNKSENMTHRSVGGACTKIEQFGFLTFRVLFLYFHFSANFPF